MFCFVLKFTTSWPHQWLDDLLYKTRWRWLVSVCLCSVCLREKVMVAALIHKRSNNSNQNTRRWTSKYVVHDNSINIFPLFMFAPNKPKQPFDAVLLRRIVKKITILFYLFIYLFISCRCLSYYVVTERCELRRNASARSWIYHNGIWHDLFVEVDFFCSFILMSNKGAIWTLSGIAIRFFTSCLKLVLNIPCLLAVSTQCGWH